jgi:hypothetical protein
MAATKGPGYPTQINTALWCKLQPIRQAFDASESKID